MARREEFSNVNADRTPLLSSPLLLSYVNQVNNKCREKKAVLPSRNQFDGSLLVQNFVLGQTKVRGGRGRGRGRGKTEGRGVEGGEEEEGGIDDE